MSYRIFHLRLSGIPDRLMPRVNTYPASDENVSNESTSLIDIWFIILENLSIL
ncbi:MAG: hypothetical protein HC767_15830 [Akkermansiaceae bacterium]|nr:hypothetical protein [Akkermansiaceae bacterium]